MSEARNLLRFEVHATTGVGAWTADATVRLPACPHVGDYIVIHGVTIQCDIMYLSDDGTISVREKRNTSLESINEIRRMWKQTELKS